MMSLTTANKLSPTGIGLAETVQTTLPF
jgi:hypothetical protein